MVLSDIQTIIQQIKNDTNNIYITYDSKLKNDLGLCSFDIMCLVAMIEKNTEKPLDLQKINENMKVSELLYLINEGKDV